MVKIVVGGQLAKEELAAKIRAVGGDKVQVTVKDDLQGAMDIMAGAADYYFGACQTGGGGSLGMAIAIPFQLWFGQKNKSGRVMKNANFF